MSSSDDIAFDLGALPEACPGLSEAYCRMIAEACGVCLEEQGHSPGVSMNVRGVADAVVIVTWRSAGADEIDTHADPEVATEFGAIAIAMLAVGHFTDYTIVRRSMKGTGFDYWLSRDSERPYRDDARLEVSGIRSGTIRQIRARLRSKARQTDRSRGDLPALVSVVEFSRPVAYLERRESI